LLLAIEHKTVDVNTAFAEFNAIVNYFVEKYTPSRTVCIKPKDPSFITPAIEYYLRKLNIVMRKGMTEKGAALGLKVNKLIADHRKKLMEKATTSTSNTKQLWALLKSTDNWGNKMNHVFDCGTPDEINNHLAAVATDSAYNKNSILTQMNDHISKFDTTKACDDSGVQYSPDEIAIILSRVTKTATGSDGFPYWVFKECARELCNIISAVC